MVKHNINYEGLELEVKGVIDKSDETTGYKCGFSWMTIEANGKDISWMLRPGIIDHIVEIVVNENY